MMIEPVLEGNVCVTSQTSFVSKAIQTSFKHQSVTYLLASFILQIRAFIKKTGQTSFAAQTCQTSVMPIKCVPVHLSTLPLSNQYQQLIKYFLK